MKRNTLQLWDKFWEQNISTEDSTNLVKAENSIGWQRIEKIISQKFQIFSNLNIIELGAGSGTFSAIMAKKGAKVTLLDYSDNAIRTARELFRRNRLNAEFIKQDALSLQVDLLNKYDISMSFGLAEHFRGDQRINIIKVHFDVLKKDGIAFICVPNKYDIPYRVALYIAEHSIPWRTGEEYPFSRKELGKICQQIGITKYAFLGSSLFYSLNFFYPFRVMKKMFMLDGNLDTCQIRKERGTFIDQYIAYGLILYGIK
jgi:2-polyprenyl-3-methyl-5-hydroxy-6-metoxy-1,4-benzoquinol methylase